MQHPSTCVIVGPSQSGKTTLAREIIKGNVYTIAPQQIVWCYSVFQNWFLEEKNIQFVEGIPHSIEGIDLIIFDDLMNNLTEEVGKLFTVWSHHKNVSIILIMQNLFPRNKMMRDITLNTHYLIVLKNYRDESQVNCLGRQAFSHRFRYFIDSYKKATTKPFGYLFIDFHPRSDDILRLRPSAFPDKNGIVWVYLPEK